VSFADVKFQDAAIRMLRASVARERLPHAMIFAGPRGVGKGLVARELARLIFCENPLRQAQGGPRGKTPDALEACGTCTHCVRVGHGTHPDLHWFRKEPDRNDFRLLLVAEREGSPGETVLSSVSLKPMEAAHSVTVIDDAEFLNMEAANALLKCLEEPAPTAILILLCADASSLPGTVLSRCQWVPFRPLPEEFVAAKLAEVLKAPASRPAAGRRGGKDEPPPSVSADEAAFVCRFAGGSIEQAVSLAGNGLWPLKRELVDRLPRLDAAVAFEMSTLIRKWADGRAKADRETSESREETALRRTAFRTALAAVVTALRDALVVKAGAAGEVPITNRDQRDTIDLLAAWPEDALVRAVGLLVAAQAEISRYVHIELATENAFVQMGRLVGVAAGKS
jgi:DNA polymerase-3 subunit delta'